jgi:signal transduction histidine kinase
MSAHHPSEQPPSGSFDLRRRLWAKLLAAFLLPTIGIVAAIGWLAYRAARVSLEEQLGESLMAVARLAAHQAARPWVLELTPGEEESRTYRNLEDKLHQLQLASRVMSIYLFDRKERAIVDSNGAFSVSEPIAKLSQNRAELALVFSGVDQSSLLFSDKNGQYYKSGFAPVWIDGKVEAAIGVDGSARFFDPLTELRQTLLVVGLVALVLVILISLIVSQRITRPLGRLVEASQAIGRGDFEKEISAESSDEIGFLAHTLNEMRSSIEERDRQLQMMLSGIAHEVRNPLGGMTLFAGLLKDELHDNPIALQHLSRINTELDYLGRVVNDFLDYARNRPVELTAADPHLELEEIRSLCEPDLLRCSVSLLFHVDSNLREVHWDRERMRRTLINLIRNAIQASKSGGTVSVSINKESNQLAIRISDQGSGIPQDKQGMVFKPFFTTRQQGTGLGLALAKNVIEAHGGSIRFQSKDGEGTVFCILLPTENEARTA